MPEGVGLVDGEDVRARRGHRELAARLAFQGGFYVGDPLTLRGHDLL
jgi:hypothetical protein